MQAGFFETDITPSTGTERMGHYCKQYIEGQRDPLKVHAVVLQEDEGQPPVALVSVDVCMMPDDFAREACEAVRQRCGILPERILLAATHTHSGGSLTGIAQEDCAAAPDLIRELVINQSPAASPGYRRRVIEAIAAAVTEANLRKTEAQYSAGRGVEQAVVRNRRFRMRNGKIWTHPGRGSAADIVAPAGPVDPEVGVMGFWRPNGELLGCVVNYACHATAYGGAQASADYIGCVGETIRGVMGPQAGVVFLNGASGDVTQVDNLAEGELEFGEKYLRMLGARIGAEAIKVLVSAPRAPRASIRVAREILRIKRRVPLPERLGKDRELVMRGLAQSSKKGQEVADKGLAREQHDIAWLMAKERLILDYLVARAPETNVEVQAIQVGPVIFLGNPAELFCALGLEIKQGSPFPFTFVVELANGCVGYVPDEPAFGPNGGGYETLLTSGSNLAPNAGTRIVQASLALAAQFVPEPSPSRPARDTRDTGPWELGQSGPELE